MGNKKLSPRQTKLVTLGGYRLSPSPVRASIEPIYNIFRILVREGARKILFYLDDTTRRFFGRQVTLSLAESLERKWVRDTAADCTRFILDICRFNFNKYIYILASDVGYVPQCNKQSLWDIFARFF